MNIWVLTILCDDKYLDPSSACLGVNNTRLVCCDRGAISFLSMIGFWKQNSIDTDEVYLMGINVKGAPLTTRNLIF